MRKFSVFEIHVNQRKFDTMKALAVKVTKNYSISRKKVEIFT